MPEDQELREDNYQQVQDTINNAVNIKYKQCKKFRVQCKSSPEIDEWFDFSPAAEHSSE
jgi:hypothetical protein